MSGSKTKSQNKTPNKTSTITVPKEYEQLRTLVITRYSVYLGRKHIMSLKMKTLQPELRKMRTLRKQLEDAIENGKVDEFRKVKKEYIKVLEEFRKKSKPYDEKIRPLSKQIKYLDILVMNNPLVKPYIKPVTEVTEIPEEFRVPQGGK